jgi:excisionase family DNA binding protein
MSRFAASGRFLWCSSVHGGGPEAMNGSMTWADLGRLPAVLTVTQAAGLLGIGRSHAYEAVQTGEWPTRVIRIGRCIRIPAEVLRLLGRTQRRDDDRRRRGGMVPPWLIGERL